MDRAGTARLRKGVDESALLNAIRLRRLNRGQAGGVRTEQRPVAIAAIPEVSRVAGLPRS